MCTPGDLILDQTYRIDGELGRGAFGVVYRATHLTLNVARAVKVLRSADDGVGSTVYTDYRNRFRLEAQLAARLTHPQVIQVYDFQERDGVLFCVMEFAPGGSLADLLAKQGPLPVERAVQWLLDAAAGLEALHDQLDAVHRDVKPANLLLDRQGRVKVADLGLAQVGGLGLSGRSAFGSMAPPHPGTPNYASPEHKEGSEPLGPTADVYGLGCVAFELLTGQVWKLARRKAKRPSDLRADVPPWLDAVVVRMVCQEPGLTVDDVDDPAKRYVDMTAVQTALRTGAEQARLEAATSEKRRQEAVAEQARQAAAATAAEEKRQQEAAARAAEQERQRALAAEQARQAAAAKAAEEKRQQEAAATRAAEQERQRALAAEQARQAAAAKAAEEKRQEEAREAAQVAFLERQHTAEEQRQIEIAHREAEADQERRRVTAGRKRNIRWTVGIIVILLLGCGLFWVGYPKYQEYQRSQTAQAVMSGVAAQADDALFQATGLYFLPVPAGEFTMGSPDGVGYDDEHPQHTVYLDAYYIGATEVTNAQYTRFVEAGGYGNADYWSEAGWTWRSTNSIAAPYYWDDTTWNQPDQPVVAVTWYEAEAFTRWLSAVSGVTVRLPTEAEWEKAACGTDGQIYPWGDAAPDVMLANFNNNVGKTTAAGAYPAGASPYGALDMAGNVLEWTADWYDAGYYATTPAQNPTGPSGGNYRVWRGGGWWSGAKSVRCAVRYWVNPVNRIDGVGFRVVSPGS